MAQRRQGAPRVLVVDPDDVFREMSSRALQMAGLEAQAVPDAMAGLRRLGAFEPQVLLVELEMPERDGIWLLRRLRDEYIGTRPRVVALSRPDLVTPALAEMGVDAVVVKPAGVGTLVAAAFAPEERIGAPGEATRELVKLSILSADLDYAFAALAKRLAFLFRVQEVVVAGALGDRQLIGTASGQVDHDPASPLWERCRVSQDARATVYAGLDGDVVSTTLAVPMESSTGHRVGTIILKSDGPRRFPHEVIDGLGALGQRLASEMAWRSVHDRIVADRDRLREMSMLDPMLGVWTRAALDQAIGGEVAACQRRGEALTCAVLDVRALRHINERFGHVVGDAALKHVAQLVRASLRGQDVVARYAGDALAMVLAGTPLDDARQVMQRVRRDVLEHTLAMDGHPVPIDCTIGLASLLGEDDTGEAALARASYAVKLAKRREEPIVVADESTPSELGSAQGLEGGATLGGMYQIVHEISRGAMGVVYRAEDLGLGRPVALKTLRPDLARDRNFVERFRTEAATLASLRHENLVQVYTFGIDGEDVYFVMELVEGEPLDDRIMRAVEQRRFIPLDVVERLIGQIGDALDAMHKAGVLHRDVKPANVLLDRVRERAVLVDVGISKRREAEHDPAGTPGFTPPECFLGTEEGPATDVYGLAALAYLLVTSALPFGEDRVELILARQRQGAPQAASAVRPSLPSRVDEVFRRALDPDIQKRFQTASDFARALTDALQHAGDEVRRGLDGRSRPIPEPFLAVSTPEPHLDGSTAVGEDTEQDTQRPARAHVERPRRKTSSLPPEIVAQLPDLRIPSLREPELPALETPQTRGVLFRSAYRVLGAKQGAQWVAQVSRRDAALAQALQPQSTLLSWHPTSAFVTMLHCVVEAGRDGQLFAHDLGRAATAATFGHFFGADPGALAPAKVLGSAALFWRRYHTWGRVQAEKQSASCVEIAIQDGPRERLVCGSTAGIFEQVALLAGGVGIEVVHVGCEGAGDAACVFQVRWRTRVS